MLSAKFHLWNSVAPPKWPGAKKYLSYGTVQV
jgi:hypothetical protein